MSYSWIGAPAEFNGTNEATGGDSGEPPSDDTRNRTHRERASN